MTKQTKEKAPLAQEEAPAAVAIEPIPDVESVEAAKEAFKKSSFDLVAWKPKTEAGRLVKDGKVTKIDQLLDQGIPIREVGVVDALLPGMDTDLLMLGQSKGKFGGGSRRVFRQTQKKTSEGNKPSFATLAVIGNRDGYIGVGYGKARETVPAREKAQRNSKLNVMKIRRGCGSWQCGCRESHSIPFAVDGKSGSVELRLIPAPKGTGLRVERECAKVLALAGVKDVWSTARGQTRSKQNMLNALLDALSKLNATKVPPKAFESLGVCEGAING